MSSTTSPKTPKTTATTTAQQPSSLNLSLNTPKLRNLFERKIQEGREREQLDLPRLSEEERMATTSLRHLSLPLPLPHSSSNGGSQAAATNGMTEQNDPLYSVDDHQLR